MTGPRFVLGERAALEGSDGEEGRVLVDTYSAALTVCNETAWVLLEALREGASVDEMTAILTATFAVPEAEARDDVLGFVHRLGALGLVDERE